LNVEADDTASHLHGRSWKEMNDSNMAGSTGTAAVENGNLECLSGKVSGHHVANVEVEVTASHLHGRGCSETNNMSMDDIEIDAVEVRTGETHDNGNGSMESQIIKLIFISLVVTMMLLPWGPLWGGNSIYFAQK
jgi:hypothetical protein